MARARSDKREKAYQMWLDSGKKMLLKDIAAELAVNETQIRKWKSLDKWEHSEKVRPLAKQKGTLPNKKSNVTNKKGTQKRRAIEDFKDEFELEDIDAELNEKQRLFCLYYVKYFNATLSAIKAGYSKDTAHVQGSRLLSHVKVRAEIKRLKGTLQEELFIDAMDILQYYMKIAFADITEYLEFGQKEVQAMGMYGPIFEGKGKNKKKVMVTVNYVDLHESRDIDGTIISEVSQGKDGIKVKLVDKMKALEKLEKYLDLLPDHHKRRIEEERLKLDKEKFEHDKKQGGDKGNVTEAMKSALEQIQQRRKERMSDGQ
jgi:phage terminase small subunit